MLRTARLTLRRPCSADADAIVALAGDLEVARWTGRIPHPYRSEDARRFLDEIVPHAPTWAITSRDTDAFAGVVGLSTDPARTGAELGYWLGRPFWGNGLATEAAQAVVDHAFAALGLAELTAAHHVGHAASARILAKLGFVETARAMRPCLALGRDLPVVALRREATR